MEPELIATPELDLWSEMDWRGRARCLQDDARDRDFFTRDRYEIVRCQLLCRACPVKRECLSWSLEHDVLIGVWGGCDEWERQRDLSESSDGRPIRRSRPPRCPACQQRNVNLVLRPPGQASGEVHGQDALQIAHRARGPALRDAAKGARLRCLDCRFEWPGWAAVMSRALEHR